MAIQEISVIPEQHEIQPTDVRSIVPNWGLCKAPISWTRIQELAMDSGVLVSMIVPAAWEGMQFH